MFFQSKTIKKLVATALTASFVATAVVPTASAASVKDFKDVQGHYTSAVDYLVDHNISIGISEDVFGTHAPIKRVDAAVWIVRALGFENIKAPDSGFTDVPERARFAVNVLKDLEIVDGKSSTTFGSSDHLTRAEMAKIITNAFELKAEGEKAHPFKDVNSTFNPFIQAVYETGITEGKTSTVFGSSDATKRGEFAKFLMKADLYEEVVPEVIVSEVNGVINDDNTVTITGKATETDKVTVVIPNGDQNITAEAAVENGTFTVTAQLPSSGEIHEISILDADGNLVYEGVSTQMSVASVKKDAAGSMITFVPVK